MVRASERITAAPEPPAGSPSLLKLVRQSGDANLGQTLLRLAARAAAEHRARAEQAQAADEPAPTASASLASREGDR